MLFRGLRLAEAGRRVLFVDAGDRIGGGWRTTEAFGVTGVETGVHLFENRPGSNRALRSLFGPQELTVDHGHGQLGRTRMPLRHARSLLYAGLVARALRRGSAERARHSLHQLGATLRCRKLPLLYPKAGVAEMFARLEARLLARGARFMFGTRVTSIDVRPQGVALHLEDGGVLDAETLVVSSRAHAPVTGREAMWQSLEPKTVTNLILAVPDDGLRFQGYVEIFANPVLKRVRRFAGVLPPDRSILTVQSRSSDPSAASIMAELARLGLVRPGLPADDAQIERVSFSTLASRSAQELARSSGGRLQFLRTVDFSDEDHSPG